MPHFDDLSPNTYFDRWQDTLLSVGWLERGHEFPRGTVSPAFFDALVRLLVDPWQPGAFAGRAPCSFCQFSGGPATLSLADTNVKLGSANVFVPGLAQGVFVAPSLVVHYIDAHEYVPPLELQRAVLECPEMGSFAYRKALLARGLKIGPRG